MAALSLSLSLQREDMIEFCLAVLLTGLAIVGFGFNVYIVLALLVAGQVSPLP